MNFKTKLLTSFHVASIPNVSPLSWFQCLWYFDYPGFSNTNLRILFSVASAFENKDKFNDEKVSFKCPRVKFTPFQMQMYVKCSFELPEIVNLT